MARGHELQRAAQGDLWHQPGDLTLRDTAGASEQQEDPRLWHTEGKVINAPGNPLFRLHF